MSFTVGGRADKFGNQYESLWVAKRLIDILSNKIRSIIVEPIGELEYGIDVWVEDNQGSQIGEQCKARNGANEKWSVSDLKNVILHIPKHVNEIDRKAFKLVTSIPFTMMDDLCRDARNSEDPEDFYNAIVCKSKEKLKLYKQFSEKLSLNIENKKGRAKAYLYIKSFSIELYPFTTQSKSDLEEIISLRLTGKPEIILSLLRNYLIDNDMLGKKIYADNILLFLKQNDILPRVIANNKIQSEKFKILNNSFNESIEDHLIESKLLVRSEVNDCIDALKDSDIVLLHGDAGMGKSGVLLGIIRELQKNQRPHLAIKLDRKTPIHSPAYFGQQQLDLPESPSLCFANYAGDRDGVLILDQLDAIRWTGQRSKESIDVCKELVNQAMTLNKSERSNLKVILVCRTYDISHDPEIKAWLSNDRADFSIKKIEVKQLKEEVVLKVVGDEFQSLTPAQIKVLSIPQNLYMWNELRKAGTFRFYNTIDLMRKFWNFKRDIIEEAGFGSNEINQIINTIVDFLSENGDVSAPEYVLDGLPQKCLQAFLSNSVLQVQGGRVMFSHQSYLDYLIASKILASTNNGSSVLKWLDGKKAQYLHQRQHFTLFLTLLLKDSQYKFEKVAMEILFSDNVRFHIKHLVLEVLNQADHISGNVSRLLVKLLNDDEWIDHVLAVVISSRENFVNVLIEKGFISKWLSSGDQKRIDEALWLLSSVITKIPDRIYVELKAVIDKSTIDLEKIYNSLSYKIGDDSDKIFKLRHELIRKGVRPRFFDWKDLVSRKPFYAVELISLLAEIDDGSSKDEARLYDHDLKEILNLPEKYSVKLWSNLYATVSSFLQNEESRDYYSKYNSFDIEKSYSRRKSKLNNFKELGVVLFLESSKVLAKESPELLLNNLEKFKISSGQSLTDSSLGLIFLSMPIEYSDFVVKWLLSNYSRFGLGLDFQRPSWMIASDLIKRFSGSCSKEVFIQLEDVLYTFTPENEDFKRTYKFRIESSRDGYFFPAWGEAQYFLVPSLSEARRSKKSNDFINVLERKFGGYPKMRFYNGYNGKGGWVGSKIEPNFDKISDKSWINIITNNDTPKKHDIGSGIQAGKDSIQVSSHDTFSSTLERAAKMDPNRFCNLFKQLPKDIDDSYVSSMLRALTLITPENESKSSTKWEMATSDNVISFWKKYREMMWDREVARSFCWLMRARRKENWPKWMIEDLYELALIHENPKVNELTVYSSDDTYENSSIRSLHSTTINSVRGTAFEAIGGLLWHHHNLSDEIIEKVDEILSESHPSILMAIVSVALPLLSINEEKALELFVGACEKDIRVGCSHDAVEFFNRMMDKRLDQLINIIENMVKSDIGEVAELASEMVMFYSQCHGGMFENIIPMLVEGSTAQRKGLAQAAKNLVKKDNYSEFSKEILVKMFNDEDKEVRDIASRIYYEDDFLSKSKNIDIAIQYIKTKSFHDSDIELFRCLDKFKGSLIGFSDLILSACEETLNAVRENKVGYSHRYERKTVISLLIRLYDESASEEFGDEVILEKCLDMWDLFFKENIDMTREITKAICK